MYMPGCYCCDIGKVLIWLINSDVGIAGVTFNQLAAVYTAMGLTVHTNTDWTANVNDYRLIHFPMARSDPSWWSAISGGTWNGRLHITSENGFSFTNSITYVNGKSGITGISNATETLDATCGQSGTSETDDMTAGLASIKYAYTSKVSGGTTLSKTVTGAHPWLARNKVGSIDFIVAGDANHASDECNVADDENLILFQNMWNVVI